MKKMLKLNETVKEMYLGILAYGVLIWLGGLLILERKLYFSSGLWLGVFISMSAVWHMWRGLNIGLDLGEDATKYVTKQNLIRYGLIVISYALICVLEIGNPVAAFLGIMGIKAGAYLQPFTHKILTKRRRR